jgi:hypothetical protein
LVVFCVMHDFLAEEEIPLQLWRFLHGHRVAGRRAIVWLLQLPRGSPRPRYRYSTSSVGTPVFPWCLVEVVSWTGRVVMWRWRGALPMIHTLKGHMRGGRRISELGYPVAFP